MSACISKHGEFSAHTPDDDHICTRCGVLDEDGLIAELHKARAALDRAIHEERQRVVLDALDRFDQQVHWVRTVLFDPEQIRLVDSVINEARKAITLTGCICPLIDATQFGEAGPRYVTGRDHRCGVHGKPVLLDVSRDPQQHPRDETGRYIEREERR